MKITEQRLKEIIREEIKKLNEMNEPWFEITYKDSRGRKKTDSMRANNPKEAKKDFVNLMKGRGFKVLKVVKEEKLTEGGRFKLSGKSEMQWTGDKIVIMTGKGKIVLDKKELYNILKGAKMHHLA